MTNWERVALDLEREIVRLTKENEELRTLVKTLHDANQTTNEELAEAQAKLQEMNRLAEFHERTEDDLLAKLQEAEKDAAKWREYVERQRRPAHSCDIEGCAVCDPTYGL